LNIVVYFILVYGDGYIFVFDIQAQTVEEAHVDVGYPDEREPSDQIASPALIEHVKAGDQQEEGCAVVTKAILAGEEIEELF